MTNSTSSGGISVPMALFLIFLVLKLCEVITWSWWWVTAPLWGGFAIAVICIVLCAVFAALAAPKITRRWR